MKKIKQSKTTLTKSDLDNIVVHMKRVFPTREEVRLDISDSEKRLNEKISHLPTKEEFFSRMDKLPGEIKLSGKQKSFIVTNTEKLMTAPTELINTSAFPL